MLINDKMFSTISVIGLGYIGLPTAALFASRKIKVVGVDVNPNVIDTINQGLIHIVEPDLDLAVHAAVSSGYLRATNTPESADAFLIAVPTPIQQNNDPDISYVQAAAYAIAPVLKAGDLVVLESTSPVGTTEKLITWLAEKRHDLTFPSDDLPNADVQVAYCPERVLPGHVLRELVNNDRIIGGVTSNCSQRAVELYSLFVEGQLIVTGVRTAEMCKLTENSFRDVNIAFANELSIICDKLNIDVWELIALANRHPRVNILQPGPGVGGHCIAVDPWFIVSQVPEQAQLIRMARQVNDSKRDWVLNKFAQAVTGFLQNNPQKTVKDVTVACFGLSFKPDIDDLRESPAVWVVEKIIAQHKGPVLIVEPNIEQLPVKLQSSTLTDIKTALIEADVVLMLVNHTVFKQCQLEKNRYIVIDTNGILSDYSRKSN